MHIIEPLFSAEAIAERVKKLGADITDVYRGTELHVVIVLTGALPFAADLIRAIDLPLRVHTVHASSYGANRTPSSFVYLSAITPELPTGARVLVIDDILDTGNTLARVRFDLTHNANARSVKTAVLLDKQVRRTADVTADFVGFLVPDLFVVGYGLDLAGAYRNLPYVGVMR